MQSLVITDFDARPGTDTALALSNAAAIQRAIAAAHSNGGGTVIVPAGQTFICGSFELKSRVTLLLEPGAVLLASPDISHYKNRADEELFGKADFGRFWIWAQDAEDVCVCGDGTLDGNSAAFVAEVRPENSVARNPRAQGLVLFGCKRVRIRDIRLRNCPNWALRPCGCEDVMIDGVSIDCDIGLVNTDGIDIDCCKRVVVKGCIIRCGDDGICIKTRREAAVAYGACEQVRVSDCIVQSSCVGLKIGTESHADIRNITFGNCIVHDSHRGLAVDGRDDAVIENIVFHDITVHTKLSHSVWWHEGEPIFVCPIPRPNGGPSAKVRNLTFRNIQIRAERGIYVQGCAERAIENLSFDNIHLDLRKETDYPANKFDPRPCDPNFAPAGHLGKVEETPRGSLWLHRCPPFFAEHVNGLRLDGLHINDTLAEQRPPGPAIELHAVRSIA